MKKYSSIIFLACIICFTFLSPIFCEAVGVGDGNCNPSQNCADPVFGCKEIGGKVEKIKCDEVNECDSSDCSINGHSEEYCPKDTKSCSQCDEEGIIGQNFRRDYKKCCEDCAHRKICKSTECHNCTSGELKAISWFNPGEYGNWYGSRHTLGSNKCCENGYWMQINNGPLYYTPICKEQDDCNKINEYCNKVACYNEGGVYNFFGFGGGVGAPTIGLCTSCTNSSGGKGCRGYYCEGESDNGNKLHYEHCDQNTGKCVDEVVKTCLAAENKLCVAGKSDCVTVDNVFPSVGECNKNNSDITVQCSDNDTDYYYGNGFWGGIITIPINDCINLGLSFNNESYSNELLQEILLARCSIGFTSPGKINACCFISHEYSHACSRIKNLACDEANSLKKENACHKTLIDGSCFGGNLTKSQCLGLCNEGSIYQAYEDCMCKQTDQEISTKDKSTEVCCNCWQQCANQGDTYKQYAPKFCLENDPSLFTQKNITSQCRELIEGSSHNCQYYMQSQSVAAKTYKNNWTMSDFSVSVCKTATINSVKNSAFAGILGGFKNVFEFLSNLIKF